MISAQAPRGVRGRGSIGPPPARRSSTAQRSVLQATGFPIGHLVATRKDMLDAHPGVTRNLLAAFEAASAGVSSGSMIMCFPLPRVNLQAERSGDVFGGDPSVLEENRTTLQACSGFGFEQGLTGRRISPDYLFTPRTHSPLPI